MKKMNHKKMFKSLPVRQEGSRMKIFQCEGREGYMINEIK